MLSLLASFVLSLLVHVTTRVKNGPFRGDVVKDWPILKLKKTMINNAQKRMHNLLVLWRVVITMVRDV